MTQKNRPPSEFIGLARALRWRVQAADHLVEPTIAAAIAPLQARLQRHPGRPLRADDLIDARRVWRSTPGYARIGQSIDITNRKAPGFRELRVSAVRFGCDLWDGGGADGLAISLLNAKVVRGRLILDPRVLGAASLHGLARRLERGRDRSDAAIFEDLGKLAFAYPQMIDDGSDKFLLPLDDGQWAGSLARLDGSVACLAQTWLADAHVVSPPVPVTQDLDALVAGLPAMELAQ